MIVRGGKHLLDIFIKLVQTGYLGAPVEDLLQAYVEKRGGNLPQIKFDPEAARVEHHPSFKLPNFKVDNSFGYNLPHGIGSLLGPGVRERLALTRNFYRRFNAIEAAYRIETGRPRERLLLEREQADYYEQHPEKLPSGTYDRVDISEDEEFE